MKFVGNILWLVLGGLLVALMYWFIGLMFCITIIGIPFGVQLLKFGTFAIWPFGHKVEDGKSMTGCFNVFFNSCHLVLLLFVYSRFHLYNNQYRAIVSAQN